MSIELKVEALPPSTDVVVGVPEITVFNYQFGLYWTGGDTVKLDDLRIRTFMYNHYASVSGNDFVYGPYLSSGAPPIKLTLVGGAEANVSWEWDGWMTDVHPPRIDDELASSSPERFYKYSQEITLYPGVGTALELDAVTSTATGGQVPYTGQTSELVSSATKLGRFYDVENSYSFLSLSQGQITSPDNYILEQRVGSWNIQEINQVGSTVTVTTTSTHGFLIGEGVRISDVVHTQGLVYNGTFKITDVTSNTFTYESRSFSIPTPGTSGIAERWVVLSGIAPSGAIGVNYTTPPATVVNDHTEFTSLIYAEKDTAISETNSVPLNSVKWGVSATLPVQGYSDGSLTDIDKAIWRFPVNNITPSTTYKAEINFFNYQASTGGVVFDIFQMKSDSWRELNLLKGTWSYINPLIDDTSPISTYNYDVNSTQVDEFAYTKFDISSSVISDWVEGLSVPDIALVKRSDLVSNEYVFVSDDSSSHPFTELRPFMVVASSRSSLDTTPPNLYLTNTTSNIPIISISGDGSGVITCELSDVSTVQTSDIINVNGTGIYDGSNLSIIGIAVNDISFNIVGNTSTDVISGGYVNTPQAVIVSAEATDNELIDPTPSNINIEKTLGLTSVNPYNIVNNISSTMTFDFNLDDIDDGYYRVQVQDASSNLSPILTSPILMNVYEIVDPISGALSIIKYVRANTQLLFTGFNIGSFSSSIRYTAGDVNDGGIIVSPSPISIGTQNLRPASNGFSITLPDNQSNEYIITSIDISTDKLTVLNAPNMYVGMPVVFAYEEIIQDPIVVGFTYYIESISYMSTTTATITLSETLGGSALNLVSTVGVGQMYMYNKETTLHVIRDGVDSSDYNNIIRFPVDDYGPVITIPTITAPDTTIQILVNDPAGVNVLTASTTFGVITGNNDISGDGTVYTFDVDVGLNSGILRFTISDVLGNERFASAQIPILSNVFIDIAEYTIINSESFILQVDVLGNSVPSQIASTAGGLGIYVSNSLGLPYGTISNIINTVSGVRFTLTVGSLGDGVFKIWASDGTDTDTLSPIVVTSISPECVQTDDLVTVTGANLDYALGMSGNTGLTEVLSNKSMNFVQFNVTGTIEGNKQFLLSAYIDGDFVVSNPISFILDNTPPIINIIGDDIITLNLNTGPYIDKGASAVDSLQGEIPVTVIGANSVDVSTVGIYNIKYRANDNCGNNSEVTRVVNVVTGCNLSLAISPASGKIGSIIDIFAIGDAFNPIPTDNIVTFNGILAQVVLAQVVGGDTTMIRVQVPSGATTGDVQVETQNVECGLSNPVKFIVFYEDEEFNTGNILNTRESRNSTTQGNISISGFQSLRPAIYNRDYAYSDFTEVADENSMVQNVASIVLTKQGERIMNPEFGTKLHTYIFSLNDDAIEFENTVLNEIIRAVQIYEARVTVDKNQSIARFSPDNGALQVLLSLITPSGINREIGLTLSSVVKVDL